MSATISIRCNSVKQKKELNEAWANLVESKSELERKVDALQYLLDQYNEAYQNLDPREVPENIEPLIREVDCTYLKYESYKEGKEEKDGFVCYEFFSDKKKPSPLGTSNELILSKCSLCKTGKLDKIERQVQNQLRKKNIRSLLDLRDILINLQIEGGLAQIFICKANLLEKKTLVVSTNGTHLPCPLEPDNEEVNVKHHCYTQITPWTMEPPCQYLIDPFIRVKVEPPEEAKEIIKAIALEYDEQTPDTKPKDVEAEVIEPEGQPEEEKEE